MNLRFRKAARRAKRLAILAKSNKSLVALVDTNLWPTSSHGHQVQGMAPSKCDRLRAILAGACAVAGVDPCSRTVLSVCLGWQKDSYVAAVRDQVQTWIHIWLNNASLQQRMKAQWAHILLDLKDPSTRWKRVKGPMAATIATALDLGWIPAKPDHWYDRTRMSWMLRDRAPVVPERGYTIVDTTQVTQAILADARDNLWRCRARSKNGAGPDEAFDSTVVKEVSAWFVKRGVINFLQRSLWRRLIPYPVERICTTRARSRVRYVPGVACQKITGRTGIGNASTIMANDAPVITSESPTILRQWFSPLII